MMKLVYCFIVLLLCVIFGCESQESVGFPNDRSGGNEYKEYEVCIDSTARKGKIDHGKYRCTSWAHIKEYKNGRKDTVGWSTSAGKIFIGYMYEEYINLPDRGQYIVDSLTEDGITQFHQDYLTYEPMYMKPGKKVVTMWDIVGDKVILREYSIFNNKSGRGFELNKETEVK